MILGYSTNAFVNYDLPDAIAMIAEMGFKGAEIVCKPPHFPPLDFAGCDSAALKACIEKSGLRVTNLNSLTLFSETDNHLPSWIRSPEERRRIRIDHTLRSLRLASFLGCRNISLPSGGPFRNMTSREMAAHFRASLEPVLPLAEELRMEVLIEPEPALLAENGSHVRDLLRELGSAATGLNFDAGHYFCAGQDPAQAFEEMFEWIGHVHLEDIAPARTHKHLIPGHGAIDFFALFKAMAELGYQKDVCLELYTCKDRPREAGLESLRHLRPIFEKAGLEVET